MELKVQNNIDDTIHLILVGDQFVGKTSLMKR